MSTSLRQALSEWPVPKVVCGPFVRGRGTNSLVTAVRDARREQFVDAARAADLATIPSAAAEEGRRRALGLLVDAETASAVLVITRHVTWRALVDFFDEDHVNQIMASLRRRLDRRSVVIGILEGVYG